MILRRLFTPSRLVVALALVVLSGWLGSRGLGEPDEGRFAEISREMALQENWLIPHLNGVPHFQKPPLTYWITAVFIRLFGPNEWAIRLTPALAAFGTLLCTMYIAGLLYGEPCRWRAGLVLLVSSGYFIVARLITTDMLLTFCITASVAGLLGYVHRGRMGGLAAFYICMGLGFLTKGPLGILIPTLAGIAIQMGQWRQRAGVVRLYWWLGLPVSLLIGLSWYIALIHHHAVLFDYFFRDELINRIATNEHDRSKSQWFYPVTLGLALLPWTAFIIPIIRDSWHHRRSLIDGEHLLYVGWLVVPYVVLTFVVSKLATYLLPITPPIAIILAHWIGRSATGDRWRTPAQITAYGLALLLPLLVAVAFMAELDVPPLLTLPKAMILILVLAPLSFLCLACFIKQSLPLNAFLTWLALTWASTTMALTTQADTLMTGGNRPVKNIAECIESMDSGGQVTVFVYGTRANGTEFYLKRFVTRGLTRSDVVLPLSGELGNRIIEDEGQAAMLLFKHPAFLIVKASRFRLEPELQKWQSIMQDGPWMLLGSPSLPATVLTQVSGGHTPLAVDGSVNGIRATIQ